MLGDWEGREAKGEAEGRAECGSAGGDGAPMGVEGVRAVPR